MAQKPDFKRPFNDLTKLLPRRLGNPVNLGLLGNIFNRFMTHDESVPLYGFIGQRPADTTDRFPRLAQDTPERDLNAITPVLTFSLGTEKFAFTVQDLLNKAKALGMNTNDLGWLYSQGNNFSPPIDLDSFTSFFNYYWIAAALPSPPTLSWNPELAPEYYVCSQPAPTALDKLNVVAATSPGQNLVLTGSGFIDQTFTLSFTSGTAFNISTSAPLLGPSGTYTPVTSSFTLPAAPAAPQATPVELVNTIQFQVTGPGGTFTLVQFNVIREPIFDVTNAHVGYTGFASGDTFVLDTAYLSSNYSIAFTGGAGVKGKISSVRALNQYQVIGGYQVSKGQRVLIKDQVSGSTNGIYIVSEQGWSRAADFTTDTWSAGAQVFVKFGSNASTRWISSETAPAFAWSLVPGVTESNTTDWQEGNYWVSGAELDLLDVDLTKVVQATRPVIQYAGNLQLNSYVVDGVPGEGPANLRQIKTEFNQLPLFDLYRYDGTHAGLVSSVFYYVEDPTADLDLVIQRRLKRAENGSGDMVFDHGCVDTDGSLLFFKRDGVLSTVWAPGYLEAEIVDHTFSGTGDGAIGSLAASPTTQQQIWTLTATSATTFSVAGSKVPSLPSSVATATVGVPYTNADLSFTISAGGVPFVAGDTFTIRVGNLERPRYAFRAEDESVQDLYGGPALDTAGVGAYLTPRPFYHNPYCEGRSEIDEGPLYAHFRSILAAQPAPLPLNLAFGGSIKLWSEPQALLASLLMQQDLTPVSMIDLAKRQYETGLNVLRDLYLQRVVDYMAQVQVVGSDGSPAETAKVNALLDALLEVRAADTDVRTVLYDTTSAVVGFPVTLPQCGLAPLVQPEERLDQVLGINVLVHHDGHLSSLNVDNQGFRTSLLGSYTTKLVLRSDGTTTPAVGSFTSTPPAVPYQGELWLRPGAGEVADLLAFDVSFDTAATPPTSPLGTRWYKRTANELYESDGFSWVLQPSPLVAWREIDLAATLNELLLLVEQRLHAGCNPDQRLYDFAPDMLTTEFQAELKRELFNFAALNGLDPLATDYNPQDAFTWNYSAALTSSFAPLSTVSVPARWHVALRAHQSTVLGVLPTERPNFEPWKLFGFSTYSAWWASLSVPTQSAYTPFAIPSELTDGTFTYAGTVRACSVTGGTSPLSGLPTVDGITLVSGDSFLLQADAVPANNGIWIVGPGAWTRAATPLTLKTYVTITEGGKYAGTQWALSATVVTIDVDPVLFKQVRLWSEALWADLAVLQPTLRTSVDLWTGNLLPPYVNSSIQASTFALTTVIPTGTNQAFEFGESSPVEEVWERSIEYGYALTKALIRFDPLAALSFAWGFNWVEVDSILYDGADVNMPGVHRFRLHGAPITAVTRSSPLTLASATGTAAIDLVLTYDAYSSTRRQSFSIRSAAGVFLDTVEEGTSFTATLSNGSTLTGLLIEDNGIPFRSGDKFHITAEASGSNLVVEFLPASTHLIRGLGQVFTVALRDVSIGSSGYAKAAFSEWDVHMGHRAGALVSTDDLVIINETRTLNSTSFDLLMKRNEIARDVWLQALRVTLLQPGTKALSAPALSGPQYRGTELNTPAGAGTDWVFRIEGYNPRFSEVQHQVLTSPPSGVAFPSAPAVNDVFFRHDLGELYQFNGTEWDTSLVPAIVTFNVLDQSSTPLVFFQPTTVANTTTSLLPLQITGVQNLVTFLFGVAGAADANGWRFNTGTEFSIDAETGRHRSWQLEIEKTVDRIYRGLNLGQGHVVNPFIDRVWLQQDRGLLAEFKDTALFDITGNAGVFDVLGVRFKAEDLQPLRGDLTSSIAANAPMYSVHAQIDEYEHLFVFADFVDTSEQSGLLYDAFSGAHAVTYQLNGRRSSSETRRPEFGGYYLSAGRVRPNLQASTDHLATVYDANHAFENTTSSKHALALLGFTLKDYFTGLDITEKTQFNFWRGLIHAKGTNLSVDAYLNSDRLQEAKLDEYWAYKLAEYGDARPRSFPELKLQVADVLQQFTQLQFDAEVGTELTNFTQVDALDETRWFSLDDLGQITYFQAEAVGTFVKTVTNGELIELPFIADRLVITGPAAAVNATTLLASGAGTITVVGYGPAVSRYNPVKLFNYVAAELIEEVPHWHPAAEQHTPTALEAVNVIGERDPARYTYSTQVQGSNNLDPLRPWGERELGRVWFDTTELSYVPYYDPVVFPNRAERLSRWGALADHASINVYEWVRSSVPPAEYAALADVEALNADLSPETRADGEVARTQLYQRDRTWLARPIAWSQTGTVQGGHPAFSGSFNSQLFIDGTTYSLELGTFAERGIIEGSRIGAWDPDPTGPAAVSEALVTSNFHKIFTDGVSTGTTITRAATLGVPGSVTLSMSEHTSQVGQLAFSVVSVTPGVPRLDPDSVLIGYDFTVELTATDVGTGEQETLTIDTAFNTTSTYPSRVLEAGQAFSYTFERFGITVVLVITTTGTYAPVTVGLNNYDPVQYALYTALGAAVSARDAVTVTPIVTAALPFPGTLSNDPLDAANIANDGVGWVAWTVPTQDELDTDSRQPFGTWRPYPGEYVTFSPSWEQLNEAIAYEAAPLVLNDGTAVRRFATTWGDWEELLATRFRRVVTVGGSVIFTHTENVDAGRTTVYVNGLAQLRAAYTVVGPTITLLSALVGQVVEVTIRPYSPTETELAFNPDLADNLTIQRQFKRDYEYVSIQQRDSEGTPASTFYYFWVKNRSVLAAGKKLSTLAIAQQLRTGPPAYLTFQPLDSGLAGSGTVNDPFRYDAVTLAGLSYLVTKDDTFKLRFARDFTLRDDPNELDLKNVHTEWGLIRPGQKTRVPEQLWNKLVDSLAGVDVAGNAVPASGRVLYDERTGASTRFGFGPEQTLAPSDLLKASVTHVVLNTKLVDSSGTSPVPDFITVLNFDESDTWFADAASSRATMTTIWNQAKVSQINEIFFAALEDILASNLELTDIFKTSRLSAYTSRVISSTPTVPIYE